MKRYLRTVLALVAVVFIVVAGCTQAEQPPAGVDDAANPEMMIDMPENPADAEAPAP